MKLQAHILLRVLTPLILLAGSVLLFHACQDRKTTPPKSSAPATPLSHDELKALGIEGDTPADTVATLVGQMKLWRKELETVKASNAALVQHLANLLLFADARKLAESDVPSTDPDDDAPEDADNEQRDLLGEMEIAARLMITGGELKEDARLTRSDRALIREAILHAARLTAYEKRQTLAQDAALPESRRNRLWEMGEAMNMFCSGFDGELFNREGEAWPEADITLVDLAMFAREWYEAQLAIAYISLINHINNLGERDQHLARPIVNITDEAHIITVNPLLARFLTKSSKMWRKLGIWLWLATQNLSDFPDDAKKLLNMIEWWDLLVMPPEEVEQVSRFKSLTTEQRQLLLSATKAPGKYTEGVVLSPRVEALFRVVSPTLWLALGMTGKHEKEEQMQMQIMREFGCSELKAALKVEKGHFSKPCNNTLDFIYVIQIPENVYIK